MHFFQRSHDFAVLQWRTGRRLLRAPYSMLYNLSRRRFLYLRTATTCLQGDQMQCFFVGHRRPILSSYFLNSQPPLSSPTVTLPSESCIGGGSSHLSCASYMIVSKTSFWNNQSCLAYVDDMGLKAYPTDKFFHASIPLQIVSQLLSIVTISRYVATMHSIAGGSRCTVTQLKTNVNEHDCLGCPSYITVFSVEHDNTNKSTVRSRKHREKIGRKKRPRA